MNSELRRRASLWLNVVLAVTIGWLAWRRWVDSPELSPVATNQIKTTAEVQDSTKQTPPPPEYAAIKSPSDRRRSIIDRLREMGVPNDLLALVAKVDFENQWDSRFKACQGDPAKMAAVQLEMNMSKDAAMRAALGEDGFKQWDQKYMLWEAMSSKVPVTPAETEAIYTLKKKLQQSQFAVEQARLNGTMDDAQINAAYDKAYSEYYQNLKNVLGEERYNVSQQLDDAFVEGNMRYTLTKAGLDVSGTQFQNLFQIDQAWKQSRAELDHKFQDDPSSTEYQAKLKALDAAHNMEYQRVLGDQAYDTLQKFQDPVYTQMKGYEKLWGLDDNKVNTVYSALKQYHAQVNAYQAQVQTLAAQGQAVAPETIKQNLQSLAAQTRQSLQNYLGQASFDKLERNRVLQFTQRQPGQPAPFN